MVFNTHSDLIVQPHRKGIQLIQPKDTGKGFPSIGSLFAMPLLVYFVDFEGVFVDANHLTCLSNIPGNQGYYSQNDLKQTPLTSLFKKESAEKLHAQNRQILEAQALTIYDEGSSSRLDEVSFSCLSFKYPVFDEQNKTLGVFGMSAFIDGSAFKEAESLADSMQRIIQTGLLPHAKNLLPGFSIDGIYLSKQEIICLRLLVAGKTMKLIGLEMGLSIRTVEYYLNNIKQKLHVRTKSELIEKVVETFWPELLL